MKQITLSDCIAQVESSSNLLAMRYEPRVYQTQLLTPQQQIEDYAVGGYIDQTTAAMIASTSWGQFQIMGYNLYGLGYQSTIVDFLTNSTHQIAYLIRFFNHNIPSVNPRKLFSQLSQTEIELVGQVYNGDGPVYANSLEKAFDYLSRQL